MARVNVSTVNIPHHFRRVTEFCKDMVPLARLRAVEEALHPQDSKFGKCLLNLHSRTDQCLLNRLNGINKQRRAAELEVSEA